MQKVLAIITTKNRFKLFKNAFNSVLNQSESVTELIVISDSDKITYEREQKFLTDYDATLIRNSNSKNYAGSLNTALFYIIKKYYIENVTNIEDTYVALLDDDDYWDEHYIKACLESLNPDTDFVVSGINYMLENETLKLTIPHHLTLNDFLVGNPHLQGSNTFVNLKSLLKIGGLDETMNSTIDRDMFVRLMMLKPKYTIVNQHLVYVNAYHNQERVTVDPKRKIQGLKKFYRKYNFLMDKKAKNDFFDRINKLLEIKMDEFEEENIYFDNTYKEDISKYKEEKLLIGFIATDFESATRLTRQIISLKRNHTRLLIIVNGQYDYKLFVDLLDEHCVNHTIVTLEEIKNRNNNNQYGPFISDYSIKDKISYISLARRILHYHLYENVNEDETIWILDEDVTLQQEVIRDNKYQTIDTPIDYIINKYKGLVDIGVGNITYDPALPALSIIRTNLIDYFYNLNKVRDYSVENIKELNDYYYDLSDLTNLHLEQPFNLEGKIQMKDNFQGKAFGRKLVLTDDKPREATNHGGNTLIFNKKVLKIPNLSLKIDNQYTRRGDFFWIQCCKNKGYKVKNLPFAVNHIRPITEFNYNKEINKLKRDVFGSSLTKTYQTEHDIMSNNFRNVYSHFVKKRLTKIMFSFYRVQALLTMTDKNNEYINFFSDEVIQEFRNSIIDSLEVDKLRSSFTQLSRYISIYERLSYEDKEISIIKDYFKTNNIRLLGYGSEANVYTDEISVFKVFHKHLNNIDLFKNQIFHKSKTLYVINISKVSGLIIFNYPYESSIEYNGGYVEDLILFVRDFKKANLVFTNVNARNFRVTKNGILKLIDYGNAIQPWNDSDFQRMIMRVYQLIKYNHISILEFKTLINLSYKGLANDFNFGLKKFKKIIFQRSKEDIHDDLIISAIRSFKPNSILDYGAGKCKIGNYLANDYNVSVFDTDTNTLKRRASEKTKIIFNIEEEHFKYDLININLVLCAVPDNITKEIFYNLKMLIKNEGKLVVSICNPFYNDVSNTELRIDSSIEDYEKNQKYKKRNRIYNTLRDEFHRPMNYYENLLESYGFSITDINETQGYNIDGLNPIGEHLVLLCEYNKTDTKSFNKSNHIIIIYIDDTSTSVIHQQYHQILNQTNLDVEFIIVYDSNSLKNKEYTQLLFSKSKKLRDKTILVFNDEKKGYERAVEEIYSKYIDNKSEYKFCTIYKIGYIFNNDNAIEEIKDSLENNNMIVHSVFNESDPFHISRDIITEFLPVSWVLKSKKMMEEILEKHEFSENEQNLFRKLKL